MKRFRITLAMPVLIAVLAPIIPAYASEDTPKTMHGIANLTSLHDFDFLVGDWRVHHRQLKARLANSHDWVEFDGTLSMRPLMRGFANVGDNMFNVRGGAYRGVSLRSYDPKTGQWAIWWLDGRDPFGDLDPPMKGRFVNANGVGIFYADDTFNGKPIRVRFTWSHITHNSAHWEQAYSADDGKTWETNWISDFQRMQ
jgi:hypothetical protein